MGGVAMPSGGKRRNAGRKPSGHKRIKLSLTLPPEKLALLDQLASETGKTRSELVEQMLDDFALARKDAE